MREIELIGYDANGECVGGYGVQTNCKHPAWTPRDMKKMLRREGAVRFAKRILYNGNSLLRRDQTHSGT